MKNILLSAHRGGPEDHYIPNSLEATKAVRTLGADLIEFDVRVTKDQKFVTLHDEYVRYRGKNVRVEQLPYSIILKHAEGACSLEDMLRAIKGYAIAHVDIKDTCHEIEIVDTCTSILGSDGFIITTLEDESVLKIRKQRPDIHVALSLGRDISQMTTLNAIKTRLSDIFPSRRIAKCDPTMVAVSYKIARYGVVRWAWRRHIPVLLWTINTPKLIQKSWRNKYIWAFTTNYPRKALAVKPSGTKVSTNRKHIRLFPVPIHR